MLKEEAKYKGLVKLDEYAAGKRPEDYRNIMLLLQQLTATYRTGSFDPELINSIQNILESKGSAANKYPFHLTAEQIDILIESEKERLGKEFDFWWENGWGNVVNGSSIIVAGILANAVSGKYSKDGSGGNNVNSNGGIKISTGSSMPPKTSMANSIYEQLNPNGSVRSRAFYDQNGNQFYRQDFDHPHFDKSTAQYY